ncbi:calcium-independent phospholipase A2-gamma isoform X2 [Kryptolebias marmoratus]|uniref:Calcium-independent phospholipase A2-gamma-like n=1 Tax=Kryptolebias marmoratus TaxID=37003 RepID=A0A3Q2ZUA2_KRYMA|nr:calcium-independent phospholipase A2-gamma isoform X2 [Kryptolebias marmoratus]XP_024859518.1 calcium-independent phospholipase A2-gamma isoform X2 [Kryptolebias marmoratus]XP_024859519.1 calcium-independent phospholipase A2-gamma isoform X2 [Kryptolebias marmoratus]
MGETRIHVQQQPASCHAGYLSLKCSHSPRIRSRKGWILKVYHVKQRLGLHTSSLCLNTSRWSAGLSQHMSRVRSTLDTVSKAVSGTHTELLSRISRLRSNALKTRKQAEASVGSAQKAEKNGISFTPPAPANSALASASAIVKSPPACPGFPSSASALDGSATTSTPPNGSTQVTTGTATVLTVCEDKSKGPRRVDPTVRASCVKGTEELPASLPDAESKSTTSKETTALFHPSALSVNLDDTYNYLAHHINSYFGSSLKAQDKKGDVVDPPTSWHEQLPDTAPAQTEPAPAVVPSSSKKSLGQYLSSSAPTVQAFVGNYIAPLVPKFRTGESRSATLEGKKAEDASGKQVEAAVSKEQAAAEEKAKKLLLQREKIIARVSVDNRTRALVQALHRASDVRVYISRVEDLSYHLLEFPETRGVAVKDQVIPCLLRLKQANDPSLRAAVREALALVGYQKPVRGRGIRILSIDGGGLRGLLALQTLHRLEALTGKPIYKLFDYICGVSTGAVIGFMLGLFQIPVKECDDLYRKLGSDVFKQNVILGTVKMGWSHAFYDSEPWETILKEKVGSHLMVETTRNPKSPKVAAVSTVVNQGLPLKAYVFRNYNLLPGVRSHYLGGCHHQLWQAIRATSAAPGYFQEFRLGNDLHQDGGLLMNNPTALAIHECKCLWPNTPLECVVSLGTGRIETAGKNSATYTSLKTKLTNIISSATDTEEVHAMLDSFLPADTYFRFNPFLNEDVSLDESRHEKLNLLQAEGVRYLERNEEKLSKVARILTREKSSIQRVTEWAKLKADMYNSLSSKV